MADEAVLKIETHIPINFTCSTLATIEKGAIVKNTEPMTAVLADSHNSIVAGIVQSEKLAAETSQNSVAVYRGGVFRVTICGGVSAGDPVVTSAVANKVAVAQINEENILGYMLEDGTNGQTKLMELNPTKMVLS
jgi:hypothetical protein